MRTRTSMVVLVSLLFFGAGVANSEERHIPPYKGSQAFESMKTLAGSWEGTHAMGGGKEEPARVEYKVSSNGSTIIETLFPGTTYEMVTVYHDKGDTLSMTHYCALGDQPQMDLVKANNNNLEFSLSEAKHIDVAKDGHMHGLILTMIDEDHLVPRAVLLGIEMKDGENVVAMGEEVMAHLEHLRHAGDAEVHRDAQGMLIYETG